MTTKLEISVDLAIPNSEKIVVPVLLWKDLQKQLQQAQKIREVAKEIHAILRTGSYGDATWHALSPAFRKMFFEMLDKALNSKGEL